MERAFRCQSVDRNITTKKPASSGNGTTDNRDNPAVVNPVQLDSFSDAVAIAEGGHSGGGNEIPGAIVKYGAGYCLA
jgi:hypothetical protein